MELDPGIIRQEDGIEKMKALIRTYCELGGTLMNLNVLSKEQVLEAHRDPSKHPYLIVRVTGFSASFRANPRKRSSARTATWRRSGTPTASPRTTGYAKRRPTISG
jgi:pyruvate-formate lyase